MTLSPETSGRVRRSRRIGDAGFAHLRETKALRIHGKSLCLGFDVSERSVSRYLRSLPRTPRATAIWGTFLRNHRDGIAAAPGARRRRRSWARGSPRPRRRQRRREAFVRPRVVGAVHSRVRCRDPGPVAVGSTLPHPASSAVLFTDRVLANDRWAGGRSLKADGNDGRFPFTPWGGASSYQSLLSPVPGAHPV